MKSVNDLIITRNEDGLNPAMFENRKLKKLHLRPINMIRVVVVGVEPVDINPRYV